MHEQRWPHEAIERQLALAECNKVSAAYNYSEHLPQLMQMIFGFVTTQAISVAARLSLADLLKDGAKSAEELARVLVPQERPELRHPLLLIKYVINCK